MALDSAQQLKSMVTSKKHPKSVRTTTLNEWVCIRVIWVDMLGKFYLINAPWGFSTVWSVIKRWLDPVTVEKISILGSSYQSALLEQIPAENLPSQFGGKCRCHGGCELSDDGPWKDPQWLGPERVAATKKNGEASASAEPVAHATQPITLEETTVHAA
jgi:hypothetical protein